jgi:hypothetical protein
MLLQNLYAVQMQLPYPWESAAALFYNRFGSIFTVNPDICIGFFEGQPLYAKFQQIYLLYLTDLLEFLIRHITYSKEVRHFYEKAPPLVVLFSYF